MSWGTTAPKTLTNRYPNIAISWKETQCPARFSFATQKTYAYTFTDIYHRNQPNVSILYIYIHHTWMVWEMRAFFDVFSSTEQAWNNGMGQPWQPNEGFCKGEMLRVSLKKHEKIKHVPIVSCMVYLPTFTIEIDQMKVNMPYMDHVGFGYT